MAFRNQGTFGRLSMRLVWCVLGVMIAGAAPRVVLAVDARHVEPSVYKIYSFIPEEGDQYSISSGSGFLVSGQRHVVTNVHVVEGGERIYIAFLEGGEAKLVEARRTESRPGADLALLEAREDLPGAPLALGAYEPDKLADVIAIGFPGAANLNKELVPETDARGVPLTDLESTVTTGVVSRMTFTNLKLNAGQLVTARTVQHNSAINPGSSGGPLLDACGQVVGINTLQGVNAQGLFFSIHASELTRFLDETKVPYAATTRPCTKGHFASTLVPLAVGLSATLALAAFLVWRRGGPSEVLASVSEALASLPALARVREGLAGWRGSPPAEGPPPVLCLRPVNGGPVIRLDVNGRARSVGRGPGVDIVVPDDTVSKLHASFVYDRAAGRVRVTDLGSSNGTYLDGVRIAMAEAGAGARLRLGTVDFTVSPETAADAAASGWMLSGFDPAGRALQFELKPARDDTGRFQPTTWTLGRDPGRADLVIDDPSVSSRHAEISFAPGEPLRLRDVGSMNGTHVDGESIGEASVPLETTGQEVVFGLARLRLSRLAI